MKSYRLAMALLTSSASVALTFKLNSGSLMPLIAAWFILSVVLMVSLKAEEPDRSSRKASISLAVQLPCMDLYFLRMPSRFYSLHSPSLSDS